MERTIEDLADTINTMYDDMREEHSNHNVEIQLLQTEVKQLKEQLKLMENSRAPKNESEPGLIRGVGRFFELSCPSCKSKLLVHITLENSTTSNTEELKMPPFSDVMESIYGARWAVLAVDKETEEVSRKIYNYFARQETK